MKIYSSYTKVNKCCSTKTTFNNKNKFSKN